MTARRLTAVLGRSVDCDTCHRPVPEGQQYWTTDDGILCDCCWQYPPQPRHTTAENAVVGSLFLLTIAIIIVALIVMGSAGL
jgi:hypothetical protein